MRYSDNYNIPLPEGNNNVKIQDLTDGLEIIDTELKLINDAPKTPVGAAGGDLQGTYPNPTIKTVTVAKGGTGATTAATALANLGGEPLIKNATAKTTLADADKFPLTDSAASNATKEITWANYKAAMKAYNDGLYGNVYDVQCSTAAGTVAKVGTVYSSTPAQPPYVQRMGTMVMLFFPNGNSAVNATLNIAGQGAYLLMNPHNNTSNVPLPPNFRAFCVFECDGSNGWWFVLNAPTPSTSITVNNTLTSTSTAEALSAAQGKVLNDAINSLYGSSITTTLMAGGWNSSKEQTFSVGGLKAASIGVIGLAVNATDAQYEAAANAKIRVVSQVNGSFTVRCMGTIPSVSIPIALNVSQW